MASNSKIEYFNDPKSFKSILARKDAYICTKIWLEGIRKVIEENNRPYNAIIRLNQPINDAIREYLEKRKVKITFIRSMDIEYSICVIFEDPSAFFSDYNFLDNDWIVFIDVNEPALFK